MKAKFVNEVLGQPAERPISTTVDKLMTWYHGGDDWDTDWQVANTMEVNGEHAQEDGADGFTHIRRLARNKNTSIKVEVIQEHGTYDLRFTVDGNHYAIQATDYPFKTNYQ